MIQPSNRKGFGELREHFGREMILSEHTDSKKDFLIDSIVSDEVVCLLIGDSHVIDFVEGAFFIFSQPITMFDLKIFVIEVMDKILANITKRNDIFYICFEFCYQYFILFDFQQLRFV